MSSPYDQSIQAMGSMMTMGIAFGMMSKAMKFGDETYKLHKTTKTKSLAQKHAKNLRKAGYKARVKKGKNKKGNAIYGVYGRKK